MKKFLAGFFFFSGLLLFSESPRVLRAPVWIYLEPVPGSFDESEAEQAPPIQEIEDIARFILSGMSSGWRFTYTPSDVRRNVAEEFSLVPIQEIVHGDPRFSMDSLSPVYPQLTCWAQIAVDEAVSRQLTYWESIQFHTGKGRGTGERTAEAGGIRDAYTGALLNAIRNLARSMEKNKPREISGEVLLREGPRLYADQGLFIAEVRVLINIRTIVPYTVY